MAESSINVTEGSGKRLHTWDRTISSTLVQGQFVLPEEYPYPSYVVPALNVSVATTSDHVVQLMAGASKHVRVRRIRVDQNGLVTSAAQLMLYLLRLTSAGSGGTSITPSKLDSADAAAGATAMTLPSSKGTESTPLFYRGLWLTQTAPTSGLAAWWEWIQAPNAKPIIIPAGTANGLALKIETGRAAARVNVEIEFVETDYL